MFRLGRRAPSLAAFGLVLATTAGNTQSYDPQRGSPSRLLDGPSDGVSYYETRLRARALVDSGKAAEAEPLVERLVREYPRDGDNWFLLATVKRRLEKFADAAAALEEAGSVVGRRSPDRFVEANIAALQLAAGNRQAAFAALRRGVFEDRTIRRDDFFKVPPFARLRTDSEFAAIAGRADTAGVSRDEGWRRDIDYLYAEVKRVSPDYHAVPLPAEFERRYSELRATIGRRSDEELVVGLNRMLAALHQGHTELLGGRVVHHLPVQFYVFPEGIFVIRATPEHQDLVGSRVVSFGHTSAEEALRLVNLMQSVDGDMQYLWTGAFLLRNAEYLRGSGIDVGVDTVDLTVEARSGERRLVRLAGPNVEGWTKLPPPPVVPPPLFLSHLDANFWLQALPEHDALYVQLNQMRNDSLETLPAFGRRLWSVLQQRKPTTVLLDLRHNNGGTTVLYSELLRTIIAFTREPNRRLYVFIGRNTYSATANFIMDLERLANPIFVGEASSECCNFHGDAAHITLPYSGSRGFVSGVRWNLSQDVFDDRREISPDVPVLLTAAAYFAGGDPALDAVFRLIDGSAKR